MTKLVELDANVTLRDQLSDAAPQHVVLLNVFHIPLDEIDRFVDNWTKSATVLKDKAGFISTKLHRGIGGSGTFLNYAVWASVADYGAAIQASDVRGILQQDQGTGTASPHLFRVVEIEGLGD